MGNQVAAADIEDESQKTPEELKRFLLNRYKKLTDEELDVMRKIQTIVRKSVPAEHSLSDELIEERRKEATK